MTLRGGIQKRCLIGIGILLMVMLLSIQPVSSAEIQCPPAVDVEKSPELVCWVRTKDNVSVRVIGINGVEVPKDETYLYAYDFKNDSLLKSEFGKSPIRLRIFLYWLLGYASEESSFGYGYKWVYYNKVNYVTLAIIHQNGSRETVNVPVYIRGNPWKEMRAFLYFIGFIAGILLLTYLVSLFRERFRVSKGSKKRKRYQNCRGLTKGAYLVFVWSLSNSYKPLGALVVYFFGNPLTVREDSLLSWSVYILTVSIFAIGLALLFNCHEKGKRENWVTGLEWVPLSVLPMEGSLFVISIAATVVYFLSLRIKALVEGMRRASIVVSPAWALILGSQVGGSTGMLTLLMGLAIIYPLLVLIYVQPKKDELIIEDDGIIRVESLSMSGGKPLDPNPPSAKELLARLDSVVRRMEWEEKTLEREKLSQRLGSSLSEAPVSNRKKSNSDWVPLGHALGFTLADYKSVKNQRISLFDE